MNTAVKAAVAAALVMGVSSFANVQAVILVR